MIRVYRELDRASLSPVPFESGFFNSGEPHVYFSRAGLIEGHGLYIDARIGSAGEFMKLLLVTDALKQFAPSSIKLFIPYFPGGREDRRQSGAGLNVKVVADVINAQGYTRVGVLDPHSSVTPALIDNSVIVDHHDVARDLLPKAIDGLICPGTMGSTKRTQDFADALGITNIVRASAPLPEGNYLVCSDVCDTGMHFQHLADQYHKHPNGTGELYLWATHGVFSHGLDFAHGYDRVFCTDSFPFSSCLKEDDKLSVARLPRIKAAMVSRS